MMPSLANLSVKLGMSTKGFTSGAAKAKASLGSIKDQVDEVNNSNLNSLASGLDKQGRKAASRFGETFSGGMSRTFSSMKASFASNMAGMISIGSVSLAALPTLAVAASGGLVAALGGGFTTIGLLAAGTTEDMKKKFTDFKDTVVSQFRSAAEPLKPVLDTIMSVGTDVVKTLTPTFKQFFSTIRGPMIDFIEQLGDAFLEMQPVIPKLATAFTKLLDNLGPKLPSLFSSLADGIIAVTNAVASNPQLFVNMITSFVKIAQIGLKVISFFTRFAGVIQTVITVVGIIIAVIAALAGSWAIAIAAIVAAIVALVGFVITHFEQIKRTITNVWNAISGWTTTAWNWITNKVGQGVQWVLDKIAWFRTLPARVAVWFGGMVDNIGRWINNAVDWVAGLPGRILSALGDLGSLLWDAGQNVIQGLIDGLQSMVGNVGDVMGSVAGNIRGFLPFSPAKEGPLSGSGDPKRSGSKIAGMVAEGMRGGRGAIDAASADMAASAAMNASPRVPGSSRVSGASQRVEIDVTGADEDMKRLMRRIVRTSSDGDVQNALGGRRRR